MYTCNFNERSENIEMYITMNGNKRLNFIKMSMKIKEIGFVLSMQEDSRVLKNNVKHAVTSGGR